MTTPTIGFVGMTHLGLNSAAAAAARGFPTVCFDPDPALTGRLAAGDVPVREPDLDRYVAEHASRLRFTADAAALASCDVIYIAPDVPTDDAGSSDLSGILALIETIRPALAPETILVLLSQVPPGFTRGLGLPPETTYYQVETLIFGRAIERALHPERFIVGCADPAAPLAGAYAAFLDAYDCPILPMRYESAELAKISINCCLVASVSVTNTMAELCERLGADWSEIAPALQLDKRIGAFAYLAPGLGIAGGNLQRDLATVCRLADENSTDAGVIHAFLANSAHRKSWPLRMYAKYVEPLTAAPVVAVLGIAYKEDTSSTKNAPAAELIEGLRGVAVRAYDPAASIDPGWSDTALQVDDPLVACDGADAVFVMNRWAPIRALAPSQIAACLRGNVIIDPYSVFDPKQCRVADLRHIVLGRKYDRTLSR
jgi:UDPglucose 6-dehydrogenase